MCFSGARVLSEKRGNRKSQIKKLIDLDSNKYEKLQKQKHQQSQQKRLILSPIKLHFVSNIHGETYLERPLLLAP